MGQSWRVANVTILYFLEILDVTVDVVQNLKSDLQLILRIMQRFCVVSILFWQLSRKLGIGLVGVTPQMLHLSITWKSAKNLSNQLLEFMHYLIK